MPRLSGTISPANLLNFWAWMAWKPSRRNRQTRVKLEGSDAMRKVRKVQKRAHKSPRRVPLVRGRRTLPRRGTHITRRSLGKRKVFVETEPVAQPKIVEVPREPITPEPVEAEEAEQEPNAEELQA